MTAGDHEEARALLMDARHKRGAQVIAETNAREATIRFMDSALLALWGWDTIGRELNITATAARRYYNRNRRLMRPGAAIG
jgi:hypothetical protein